MSVERRTVASSEEPSGRFRIALSSPWSSGGIQSRPTRKFRGTVSRNTPAAATITTFRRSSDQLRTWPYRREIQAKKGHSFVPCAGPPAGARLSRRELSIGVRVKLTSIETRMAKAIVQPNWLT